MGAQLRSGTLVENSDKRRQRLTTAIDRIIDRCGRWTAVSVMQEFERKWRMRTNNRSSAWKTRID